jgi:hypothetical protein
MIDHIALSIGHALIAIALVRLFLREAVDIDPLIGALRDQLRQKRMAASGAGRHAKRRAEGGADAEQAPAPADQPSAAPATAREWVAPRRRRD